MTLTPDLTVRVSRREQAALRIATFELASLDGTPLPSWSAGAHIDVHVPGGPIRQYSLANDPAETHRYLIGVLDDPASRGGSAAMHAGVAEGDTIGISVPRNHFPLDEDAGHSVLIAGGIGVTPILSMAERLVSRRASFELHYCTRSADHTAFRERLASERFDRRVHHHYDDGPDDQRLPLDALLRKREPDTHLYVCGPTGFMDWILTSARDAGWDDDQVHFEFFSGTVDVADAGAFDVRIASSGEVIRVDADQTVIAALAAHGIDIPMSCEQGVCGTCLTGVLEGDPDHKDVYLMPKERERNDQFLPCCSRARSPLLVLDI